MKKVLAILIMVFAISVVSVACIVPLPNDGPLVHEVYVDEEVFYVVDGEALPEPLETPEKEGKYFIGWFIGDDEYDFYAPVTENIKIVSKWGDLKNVICGRLVGFDGGNMRGATVSVIEKDVQVLVNDDGNFILEGIEPDNYTVEISKEGYLSKQIDVALSQFDYTAQAVIGEVELSLLPVELGTVGGDKCPTVWSYSVTRDSNALIFTVSTLNENAPLNEGERWFDIWFSAGETPSAVRNYDVSYIQVYGDGRTTVYNFPENVHTLLQPLTNESHVISVEKEVGSQYTIVTVRVSYNYFKLDSRGSTVDKDSVVGITLLAGATNSTIDYWYRSDMLGASNSAEVIRGHRYDYLRIDKYNNLFEHVENEAVWIVDGNATQEGVTIACSDASVVSKADGSYRLVVVDNGQQSLELTYSMLGYESLTQTIAVANNNRYYDAENVALSVARKTLKGVVTDGENVVSGAVVVYGEQEVITDAEGKFSLENVPMNAVVEVTVSKEDYTTKIVTFSVEQINAESFSAEIELQEIIVSTLKGKVNDIAGSVSGAQVTLGGTSMVAITDANGEYIIENVKSSDYKVIITKAGYENVSFNLESTSFITDEVNLGETCLTREYLDLGEVNITNGPQYQISTTRNEEGFLYRYVSAGLSSNLSTERVAVWLSVGETTASTRNYDTWFLQCFGTGQFYLANFPSNKETRVIALTNTSEYVTVTWTVYESNYVVDIFIDYDAFALDTTNGSTAVSKNDIVGITFTTWSNSVSGLWYRSDMLGASNSAEVIRGNRYDYLRIDKYNNLFEHVDNEAVWIIDGNATQEGVTVACSDARVVSKADGSYRLVVVDNGQQSLELTYSMLGYESLTQTIAVANNNRYYGAESVALSVARKTLNGVVTDGENVVSGAVVVYGEQEVITDAEGKFSLENVPMNAVVEVTVSKEGYLATIATFSVEQINTIQSHTIVIVADSRRNMVGNVTDIDGALQGVTVTIEELGIISTTDLDGAFIFEEVESGNYTITVLKDGYIQESLTVESSAFVNDEVNLGETCLTREYLDLGEVNITNGPQYQISTTRNEEGFLYRYVSAGLSSNLSTERVAVWLSVGETTASTRNYDTWFLQCFGTGQFYLANFPSNKETRVIALTNSSEYVTVTWTVYESNYVVDIFIDYDAFALDTTNGSTAVSKNDIVGITFTTWSNSVSGLWYRSDMLGASNSAEVIRGNRYDYLRIDSKNVLFENTENAYPTEE